ncbi:SdpI/YhfL family protein [Frondihabitans sp. PhB188]|uniref:SdpI family protein n=1 Tax=Frondihabitans sp. PhB188 TaxID=2485200 RepID=UPI000F483197|nr:SdpI family protein [Frondihabitans sp. PhB188]ROQ40081.1 SdpI/YhfL family protein [Frondihabitans sp. PhB188]
MIVAAIVLFVFAAVVMGTTVLAAAGVVKLNGAVGIRIGHFLDSQDAWEAGHLKALLPVTVGGLVAVAGGLVALQPAPSAGLVVVAYVLLFAFLTWGIVRGNAAAADAPSA